MTTISKEINYKLGAIESSILNYVINLHAHQTNGRKSAYFALLTHSCLLSRGAKLINNGTQDSLPVSDSILPTNWAANELIRLNYRLVRPTPGHTDLTNSTYPENLLQISVTQLDRRIHINTTDTTTDKFGHVEFFDVEHIHLESNACSGEKTPINVLNLFPQLLVTLKEMEENLWKIVLPEPLTSPSSAVTEPDRGRMRNDANIYDQRNILPHINPLTSEYGRSDLDPLGNLGRNPLGVGGMLMDPHRPLTGLPTSPFSGPDLLPGGAVPPGARFEPIWPAVVPSRSNRSRPDPDSAMPIGLEDMYM